MTSEDIIRPTAIVAGGGPSGALTAKVCAYHISVLFVSAITFSMTTYVLYITILLIGTIAKGYC